MGLILENRWALAGIVLYSLLGVLLLTLHFTNPIRRLTKASQQLSFGALSTRCAPLRLRIPDELSTLVHSFNHMAQRLEEIFSAQKRLMRDVSHELRSPLARMRVALELATRTHPTESQAHLAMVEREIHRLDRLIHEILTLAHPDAGQPVVLEGMVDLQGMLTSIAADVTLEGRPSGRHVILAASEERLVKANPEALHSALENVVRNALRYTPPHSTVDVTLTEQAQQLHIQVRDHGPGVAEADLLRIFKPFYRTSAARERESGGYGLGLAIAQRVISEHHGTLWAANHSEGGLVVHITLPIAAPEPE